MRPLLGPLLVLVGLGTAAVYGPMQVSRARATMSWPTTDGTVLDSQVVSSRVNRRNKWGPQVHYEYFIAGTRHESDSVWPGGSKSRTGRSFAGRWCMNPTRAQYVPTGLSFSFGSPQISVLRVQACD